MGITDRCTTCHQGADKKDFIVAPEPFKTHTGEYLMAHPIEKFGCVICHDGNGEALTVSDAHGNAGIWRRPILTDSFTQSSCRKCHAIDQSLPLTAKMHEAPVLMEGWRLFQIYNCIGCHKLSGYERPERISPDLTIIGSKIKKDWLIKWLKDPKDYLPKTKMPRFDLKDEDIESAADYLMSLKWKNPPASIFTTKGYNPSRVGRDSGKNLVTTLGCLGCHKINKKGSDFGPDLSHIGSKVNPEWLFQWLKNPKAYQPKTTMPKFNLSEKDIQNVVAYLISLKKEDLIQWKGYLAAKRTELLPDNMEKGRKLIKNLGCTGCHKIKELPDGYAAPPLDGIGEKRTNELVFSNIRDVERTLINWLLIKVTDPKKFTTDKIINRMPNYGFNKQQATALVTFLLSMRKDSVPPKYIKTLIDPNDIEMKGKKIIEKYNCLGCHKINKKGGDIGPDLTNEGKRVRPEWLFTFLKAPFKIRQLMDAKMPDFNLPDKEINTIIEYLSFVSKESYPYIFKAKKEVHIEDINDGEKLYQEVMACIACHSVNGRGGQIGPDHTDAASRLKREWIERWLKNPQAIMPDTRMPRFKFKDWEFEALTNYLMTLGNYRFLQVKRTE